MVCWLQLFWLKSIVQVYIIIQHRFHALSNLQIAMLNQLYSALQDGWQHARELRLNIQSYIRTYIQRISSWLRETVTTDEYNSGYMTMGATNRNFSFYVALNSLNQPVPTNYT